MSRKKTDKLKIAMLGHKRVPSREGGVEIVVEELSARMADRGHRVVCYNRIGHHVSGKEFDADTAGRQYRGIELKSVITIDKKGLAAMTSSFFGALKCAFCRYDIVHFHAEGPCAMLWLPKLFGKRCIATVHGLDHQRAKWGNFASKYIMIGEKTAVKYADEIIVLSRGVEQYFADTYNRKTEFIPNGVSRPNIRKPDFIKSKFGLDKNEYILYLGRIVPEKGLRYLISAFKNVNTSKRLVIAGGASDTDEFLNELKELAGDDERIIFTGFVYGQLLEELYSNAYVYTLPSDLEGMPLSLLEAMSYSNCCLVSSIAECADVVGDNAVIFEKGNTDDLCRKLQALCDDSKIVQAYKDGAAEYICSRYNWDDVTDRTLELYNKALKNKAN